MPKKPLLTWRRARLCLATATALLTLAAFAGLGGTFLMRLQAVPALLRLLAAHAWGAAAALAAIVVSTALLGRLYCAAVCPLGVLQDLLGWLGHRLRHVLAGLALGVLAAGYATLLFDFDPYSILGRLAASFSLGALLPPAVLLAVAAARPRAFCTTLCPVGALLGLVSRHALYRLAIGDGCTRCGKCAAACAAHCISLKDAHVDNDRCHRCLNCLSVCPTGAIALTRHRRPATPAQTSADRRDFLASTALLVAGAAASAPLLRLVRERSQASADALDGQTLPPGAGDARRLAAKCTGCQLCVSACRANGSAIIAIRNGLPTLRLDLAPCQPDCHACAQACPTGAIAALHDKHSWAIATALYNPRQCLVASSPDAECDRCRNACPSHAITPVKAADGRLFPRFSDTACTGCARCLHACPADAIAIAPLATQRRAADERVARNSRRTAVFDPTRCRVLQQGRNCGHCARACPTGAITVRKRKTGLEIPQVNADFCIACGACEKACPVSPKAMTVIVPPPAPAVEG